MPTNNITVDDMADVEATMEGLAELSSTAQNTLSALSSAVTDDHALVNQLLGQAQMADAFGKFSQTVWASKLAYVKENKLYKAIAGQKNPNGLELSGTWLEFCNMLGVSDEKANQDIANLRAFGEEALESMSRMGIGYREMRQFRKLPEDQKTALIEVAKSGDKESFVELAEEIISKHSKEKEQLQAERDEAHADYDAQSELLAKKNKELDATKQELEKARRRILLQSPDEAEQQLQTEAAAVVAEIDSLVKTKLDSVAKTLVAHGEATVTDQRSYLGTMVAYLEKQLRQLKAQYALDEDTYDHEPDWMKPDALAHAEALVAAQQAQLEQ